MADKINAPQAFRFPWREGNRFEVLVDSTEFFPKMLNAINSAQQYILLEMYLIESGTIAKQFINAIVDAADRGVQIYLLFDDYGAMGLKKRDRNQLKHENIQIVYYNPLLSFSMLYNLYRIFWHHIDRSLYRNHRKLLLTDGKIAFTGGTGITDEFNPSRHPERRWRETMVEIQGPVLVDWQQLFIESWNTYAKDPLELPLATPSAMTNGHAGRVAANEAHQWSGIQRSLTRRIYNANRRIWFATAYFVPPYRIRRKLKRAARAGVDVRLLLPGPITDHPGVRHASRRYYGRLLKNGVRIFEYQPRFFHAKTVLCDNWVTIGSSNFDRWNLQWNLEANQNIEDQKIAKTVENIFNNDFENCIEWTYQDWYERNWRSRALEWFWRKVELVSIKLRNRHRRRR
ncbi:phospholipase D-like domain-containing protein [Kaarinaea lacus]